MATNQPYPFKGIIWISQTDDDWIGRCPFCGDSQKSSSHGHFYLAKRYPIYHCFRCNAKGYVDSLEKHINERSQVEWNLSISYDLPMLNVPTILKEMKDLLKFCSYAITPNELDYFKLRVRLKSIGESDIIKYSLFPDYYARGVLYKDIFSKIKSDSYRTWVMRGFGGGLNGRAHDPSKSNFRYINGDYPVPWKSFITDDVYVIRSKAIENYGTNDITCLVIAEGLYDIIPLYLNRLKYRLDDTHTVYMAALSSAYSRCISVFNLLFEKKPNNVYIFADNNITKKFLSDQFRSLSRTQTVIANWPNEEKDWENGPPIGLSIKI